ncbi:hypothetical protein [Leptolyngbya sp. FACHB-261]|uniref:hypothetical protein n=1 Tax=Leptolyngbya sp. FACHB-261 TaxID=2692806 RepID=UPI001689B829|nr:hypothetical protein [Leptolyngbya sp. FACHB-261]MBD2100003.1 hypothetical protein [Leptolyngbya sp. FACHB-261]
MPKLTEQLELQLWQSLKVATEDPEAADVLHLGELVEAVVALTPPLQQMTIAAVAIEQLTNVLEAAEAVLSQWLDTRLRSSESSSRPHVCVLRESGVV